MIIDDGGFEDLDQRPAAIPRLVEQLGRAVHVVGAHHDVDVTGLAGDELAEAAAAVKAS